MSADPQRHSRQPPGARAWRTRLSLTLRRPPPSGATPRARCHRRWRQRSQTGHSRPSAGSGHLLVATGVVATCPHAGHTTEHPRLHASWPRTAPTQELLPQPFRQTLAWSASGLLASAMAAMSMTASGLRASLLVVPLALWDSVASSCCSHRRGSARGSRGWLVCHGAAILGTRLTACSHSLRARGVPLPLPWGGARVPQYNVPCSTLEEDVNTVGNL
mmetsp:Transcript_93468/g.290947  ORF Transcript_93468/g.290947 Transcript_93468/m.290947 type:complete len:218 (-) Transcript_93468:13-666(-)